MDGKTFFMLWLWSVVASYAAGWHRIRFTMNK